MVLEEHEGSITVFSLIFLFYTSFCNYCMVVTLTGNLIHENMSDAGELDWLS